MIDLNILWAIGFVLFLAVVMVICDNLPSRRRHYRELEALQEAKNRARIRAQEQRYVG